MISAIAAGLVTIVGQVEVCPSVMKTETMVADEVILVNYDYAGEWHPPLHVPDYLVKKCIYDLNNK